MPDPYDEMTADLDTLDRVLEQLREDNARLMELLARKDSVIAAQAATIGSCSTS